LNRAPETLTGLESLHGVPRKKELHHSTNQRESVRNEGHSSTLAVVWRRRYAPGPEI